MKIINIILAIFALSFAIFTLVEVNKNKKEIETIYEDAVHRFYWVCGESGNTFNECQSVFYNLYPDSYFARIPDKPQNGQCLRIDNCEEGINYCWGECL